MIDGQIRSFPAAVSVFLDRWLPEEACPVGYAALIEAFGLSVPVPIKLAAIGSRHKVYHAKNWQLYTPRHQPDPSLSGHLTFALRYEGLDLALLKALFRAVGPCPIADIIRRAPTGAYARRIWFLYEWLLDSRLDIPDAARGTYALVVDPDLQWAWEGVTSTRHRVRNNLPGTREWCPLIFRTPALDAFVARNLGEGARRLIAQVPADLLARTAAFLLLKDSRFSFQIEGEDPPQDRIQRWGQVIGEAGRRSLTLAELERLQRIVIGDARFVQLGLRRKDGFVGEHDRLTGTPLPDHISARPQDLASLVGGMTSFQEGPGRHLDPVLAAAMLAFGFVYVHPFEDGNGRLHRYLVHHTLAEGGFNPAGLVFPVSAVILDRIDDYRRVLESYSRRLLPHIHWRATGQGNVEVINDTADFYRYFDATPHAEFLFQCVARTIEMDLPAETAFLRNYDAFRAEIALIVDMPDRLCDLLFRFLRQNDGILPKRARECEFSALTEYEVARVEAYYGELRWGHVQR